MTKKVAGPLVIWAGLPRELMYSRRDGPTAPGPGLARNSRDTNGYGRGGLRMALFERENDKFRPT